MNYSHAPLYVNFNLLFAANNIIKLHALSCVPWQVFAHVTCT